MGKEKLHFDPNYPARSSEELEYWFKDKYNQVKFFGDSEVIPREKVNFLLKELKTHANNTVTDAKLLYRYDPRNTLNYHNFIDQKENLLVVIKLISN